jgi:anti-sigma factor RsiW
VPVDRAALHARITNAAAATQRLVDVAVSIHALALTTPPVLYVPAGVSQLIKHGGERRLDDRPATMLRLPRHRKAAVEHRCE